MLHVLADELAVVALVLVRVGLVERAERVGLRAAILRLREAELGSAQHLGKGGLQGLVHLAFLGHHRHVQGVLRLGQDVVAVAHLRLQEGAIGLLGHLAQATAEHAEGHVLEIVHEQIVHVALGLIGHGFVLEHHFDHVVALLLVLVDDDDGLGIVGHRLQLHLGGISAGGGYLAKHVLDLLLHLVDVHVAHNDDALVVGAVPLLVVLLQERALEVVDDFHQADGHAVAVLRAGIELGQVTLQHAHLGAGAQAPLLVDDATLLLDFLLLQQQAVGPVPQNH